MGFKNANQFLQHRSFNKLDAETKSAVRLVKSMETYLAIVKRFELELEKHTTIYGNDHEIIKQVVNTCAIIADEHNNFCKHRIVK